MSDYDKSVFSGCGGSREPRGFCFGCDEGRAGTVLTRTRRFEGIPVDYDEMICKGCDYNLNLIRPFIIPVIQHDSHEGVISWRIPGATYNRFRRMLDGFHDCGSLHEAEEDEYTVILSATDTEYGDEQSVDTLLERLSQIRHT